MEYNVSGNVKYLGNKNTPYLIAIEATDKTLTSYTIEETTRIIYASAFTDCTSLKSITIPDSVREIGSNAFYGCTALTNVTFGSGLSYIGMNAFYKCSSLSNATFKNKSGWQYIYYSTNYESISVTDPSENARKLTYPGYTFKRG